MEGIQPENDLTANLLAGDDLTGKVAGIIAIGDNGVIFIGVEGDGGLVQGGG